MPGESDRRSGRVATAGFLLLAFMLGYINTASHAAEYVFYGNWIGRGFTSGWDDCPQFQIYMSIAGHHVEARILDNLAEHEIELSFDLGDSGKFKGTFQTKSGHNVRITGSVKGERFEGYLRHYICKGPWYAAREQPKTPAPATVTTQTKLEPSYISEPSLAVQLQTLRDLKQKKLIDQLTYEQRQKALLDLLLKDSATTEPQAESVMPQIAAVQSQGLREDIRFGRYYALVIAINAYKHLPKLSAAVVDGLAVAQVLRDLYGFQIEMLIDASRYEIISAITEFRGKLGSDDNLLIYYAGHGVLDEDADRGYWIPVDGELDNPANWVANSDITSAIRAMRAKHVMLVVDSCYSGTLTRDVNIQLPTTQDRLAWFRRISGKVGRTVLTSGGLEPVVDSGGGKHSVFAKAFLDVLRENTEVIDGQTVFSLLKRPVVVNAVQTPEYSDLRFAGHDGGDFVFVRQ